MFWDGAIFILLDPTSRGDLAHGSDVWAECHHTLNQKSCEYSSGVCFLEERRTWGYVTQVKAGCKQDSL
jgi:hypothetical protein